MQQSLKPDILHSQVLMEGGDIERPLFVVFGGQMGQLVSEDWQRQNVNPILKKGEKNESEKPRPDQFSSVPGR